MFIDAPGNGFGLNGGQDHMIGIHQEHRPRAPAIGCVDQHVAVARLLDDSLDGRGFGTHDGKDPAGRDHIAEADIDQFHDVLRLFDVLRLLADLLQLRLDLDHGAGLLEIVSLGADGVGFPVELLQQKIQFASNGAAARQHGIKLAEMAAQTHRFLVHRDFVGIDGGFLQDAGLVDIGPAQDLLHLLRQARAVFRQCDGAALFDLFHKTENCLGPAAEIGLQRSPLGRAHGVEPFDGLVRHREDVGGDLLLVVLLLLDDEHVGQSGERRDRDVVPHAVFLRDGAQRVKISFQHGLVERNFFILPRSSVRRDEHVDLAAGDDFLDAGLYGILRISIDTRQFDRAVEIAVVDGAQLHGDLPVVDRLHRPAVAGHAFNQSSFLRMVI